MTTTGTRFVDTIAWDNLQHAYGPAGDLPPLLEKIAAAKGRKLYDAVDELCSRVLHQGTIYSASPPVVHFLIELLPDAGPNEKAMLYGLLEAFADSARMAIDDGPAPSSCAGGDPVDGAAIRDELRRARSQFESDLQHPNAQIRSQIAQVLTCFSDDDAAMAAQVRHRYLVEDDSKVRGTLLSGLSRVRSAFPDWPDFLNTALARESEPANRLVIRCAQVRELGTASDSSCMNDLVASYVQTGYAADPQFFEVIKLLGAGRERAALLKAFDLATDDDTLRVLAEHLLRLIFDDQRTGWGQTSSTRLAEDGSKPPQTSMYRMALRSISMLLLYKIFPSVMRWRVRKMAARKPKGIRKVDYWGLNGTAPEIPQKLSHDQRAVLAAFAAKPELWQFRTNLWDLFGLPSEPESLSTFGTAPDEPVSN